MSLPDTNASLRQPFVGLRPFAFADADFFFGQEQLIDTLERLVLRGRMVSVVGSSGNGKSSLVRAGLLPRLSQERCGPGWSWVEMRPGDSPVRNLADALARPNTSHQMHRVDELALAKGARIEHVLQQSSFGIAEAIEQFEVAHGRHVLILVDQFEEIFRFADLRAQQILGPRRVAEQRDEATAFIQLLLSAARDESFQGSILITMRSDFIGECARFHGLSELVTETQFLVPGLTRDQRSRAIRGPVQRAGAEIEPGLVQQLLNDSDKDPDPLPLMQHALMRCWNRAIAEAPPGAPPKLTIATYKAIGGEAALTQHGDEMLERLEARESEVPPSGYRLVEIAKRVFQCLTDTDSKGRVIRRPQTLSDLVSALAPDPEHAAQRDALGRATRLAVLHFADAACSFLRAPAADELQPGDIIDIGHEVLIRRWQKLGGLETPNWVREEQGDGENYRALLLYAQKNGMVPKEHLRELEQWWAHRRPTRFWAGRYGQAAYDRFDEARMALVRSRKRVTRARWTRFLTVSAVVLLVATLGMWTLMQPLMEADDRAYDQGMMIATEGVDELRERAPYEVVLLADLGSHGSDDGAAEDQSVLHAVLHRVRQSIVSVPELLLARFGLSLRGREVAAHEALAYAALSRMRELAVLFPPRHAIALALAPDGSLAMFDGVKSSTFWNLESFKAERTVRGPRMQFGSVLFYPGGRYVLTNEADRVQLINLDDESEPPLRVEVQANGEMQRAVGAAALSADGRVLATVSPNAPLRIWPLMPGADGRLQLGRAFEADVHGSAIAVSADGSTVAIGELETGAIRLYTVEAGPSGQGPSFRLGDPHTVPEANQERPDVWSLAFDPKRPDLLLATYEGAQPRIWNVRTLATERVLVVGYNKSQVRGFWSPDGRYLAMSAMPDQQNLRVWDLAIPPDGQPQRPSWTVHGTDGPFSSVVFDRSDRLVGGSVGGTVWIWAAEPALSRGLDPNASTPAPVGADAPTTLQFENGEWRIRSTVPGVANGRPIRNQGPILTETQSTVSPDGRWALLTPQRGPIFLYDLRDPDRSVGAFGEGNDHWSQVAFGADMDRILATDAAGRVHAWHFFQSTEPMRSFIAQSLPLVCGSTPSLPEQIRRKARGDFWWLLLASPTTQAPCTSPPE
jgi:WD40 repeat protein